VTRVKRIAVACEKLACGNRRVGWLSEYKGPGVYGRDASVERDVKD